MATTRGTRIGIWIIAVVMTVGTIGSFLVMVLANDNQKIDEQMQQKQYEQMIKEQEEESKRMAEENAANSEAFGVRKPAKFDAAQVKTLKTDVLTKGKGATVKATDTIKVSYTGWLSSGKIFDSSKKKDAKDAPVELSLDGGVIEGWTEGLAGAKVGSTVLLTIPADKAYKETGSGIIPPNAPLQFVVKIHSIGQKEAQQ